VKPVAAQALAKTVGGKLVAGDPAAVVSAVSIDSRRISPGELFIAIKGERFDGHDFIAQSVAAGAAGVVGERFTADQLELIAREARFAVRVDDTLLALQRMAADHRSGLNAACIAVTGSTGKTTAKDMISAALSDSAHTVATEGSLNNEIGLPLTILRAPETVEILVVEMGMRGLGQIDSLCSIARPDVGVVTNVNDTHIELLGSRERIALAKSELVAAIPDTGGAVLNGDDPLVVSMAGKCRGRVITVGLGPQCDLVACDLHSRGADGIQFSVRGREHIDDVRVGLPGMHNVYNALFAIGVCHLIGFSAESAARRFEAFSGSAMRMTVRTTASRITVIDDSYNASPASMHAALKTLMDIGSHGRTIAVLGDMLELGHISESAHKDVGRFIANEGPEVTLTVGERARLISEQIRCMDSNKIAEHFSTNAQAIDRLRSLLQPGDTVLVKGSRGAHMDEVVESLLAL
jgi:UDP-N-acetylmuramoyl-tripeptide--D-alanyl-D-alanine ligase